MLALPVIPTKLVAARRHAGLRAVANGKKMPYQSPDLDGDPVCAPSTVSCDNEISEDFTKLVVKVEDFQGLLHVIAWVLNGMEVRVTSAELEANDDGIAHDVFYVTNLLGQKLSTEYAQEVAGRVHDFVMNCKDTSERIPIKWQSGQVLISNEEPDKTVITVLELEKRIGFLLEVASVLSGIGIKVDSAKVRTCSECIDDPTIAEMLSRADARDVRNARIMEFEASEACGSPLTQRSVRAVLFTLGLVSGPTRHEASVAPTLRSFACKFRSD